MSNWINETEKPESLALYLARRGALYRKVPQWLNFMQRLPEKNRTFLLTDFFTSMRATHNFDELKKFKWHSLINIVSYPSRRNVVVNINAYFNSSFTHLIQLSNFCAAGSTEEGLG